MTIARALYNVFIAPFSLLRVNPSPLRRSSALRILHKPRSQARLASNRVDLTETFIFDDAITAPSIAVVDERGVIHPAEPLTSVRTKYDPFVFRLLQVAAGNDTRPATCRLLRRTDFLSLMAREFTFQSRKKAPAAQPPKTIEMNWAIEAGDLAHRIKSLKGFLNKGRRVEVILAPKRRGKIATLDDARNVVDKLREAVKEVDGSKEWKEMNGELLKALTLYFEGDTSLQGDEPE